tara:strand:- start:1603 stop:1914 length:312 start_codon:yes stop_codon:yes gene_type:complete
MNYLEQVEKGYNYNQISLNEFNNLKKEYEELSDEEKSKKVFYLDTIFNVSKWTDREIQESIAINFKLIMAKNSRISWWVTFWSVLGIISILFHFISSFFMINY